MLEHVLIVGMGRRQCDEAVTLIIQQPEILTSLFQLVTAGKREQRMKGSWVLSRIHEVSPSLVKPHYSEMLMQLETETIGGVKRELLKCFVKAELNNDSLNQLLMITLKWVTDPQQDLAVRYVCFKILKGHMANYPELKSELDQSIQLYREKFGRFP